MWIRLFYIVLWAFLHSDSAGAEEFDIPDTEDAACQVLKAHVAHISDMVSPHPDWYCDFSNIENEYLRIVALRGVRRDVPPEERGMYSNLMGWYAVMRRSNAVLLWDVGEDRIVPLDYYDDK